MWNIVANFCVHVCAYFSQNNEDSSNNRDSNYLYNLFWEFLPQMYGFLDKHL